MVVRPLPLRPLPMASIPLTCMALFPQQPRHIPFPFLLTFPCLSHLHFLYLLPRIALKKPATQGVQSQPTELPEHIRSTLMLCFVRYTFTQPCGNQKSIFGTTLRGSSVKVWIL